MQFFILRNRFFFGREIGKFSIKDDFFRKKNSCEFDFFFRFDDVYLLPSSIIFLDSRILMALAIALVLSEASSRSLLVVDNLLSLRLSSSCVRTSFLCRACVWNNMSSAILFKILFCESQNCTYKSQTYTLNLKFTLVNLKITIVNPKTYTCKS